MKELGELLLSYLWLVLPFWKFIDRSELRRHTNPSSFLWPHKTDDTKCWTTEKLTRAIERAFEYQIDGKMGTAVYRHVAIAISRKHLQSFGFKKDYENSSAGDLQATHTPSTAGAHYARLLTEAAGQVAARKVEYRKVSQEWHRFLEFLPSSLPPRENYGKAIGPSISEEDYEMSIARKRIPNSDDERERLQEIDAEQVSNQQTAKVPRLFRAKRLRNDDSVILAPDARIILA